MLTTSSKESSKALRERPKGPSRAWASPNDADQYPFHTSGIHLLTNSQSGNERVSGAVQADDDAGNDLSDVVATVVSG